MDRLYIIVKRMFLFVGLLFLILLVMDFNGRMAELTRLSAQHDRESDKLVAMEDEKRALESQIEFASSDISIENWARESGRWAKTGDYVIVPLPGEDIDAHDEPYQPSALESSWSKWDAWMAWFLNRLP